MRRRVLLCLLLLALVPESLQLGRGQVFLGGAWPSPTALTFDRYSDFKPHLLQASDGRVWLFWESLNQTSGNIDIFYKIQDATIWSPTYRLTSDPGQDTAPAVAQLANGTLFVAWSSNRTGNFEIFLKSYSGKAWSGDTQLTRYQRGDFSPSLVALDDGGLWLFWMRETPNGTDIFLRTFNEAGWSSEIQATTDPARDLSPSATRLRDGRIILAWARTISVSEQQIYYKTYTGGVPSAETQLTSKKTWNGFPWPVQDRNGTLWIFWAREFPFSASGLPGQLSQNEIMYSSSSDNMVTWSPLAQMTIDPKGFEKDDIDPSVIQARDRTLWVAWSSDPETTLPPPDNETSFSQWDIYLTRSDPILVHDVAVSLVTASNAFQYPGGLKSVAQSPLVRISVDVVNLGDYDETVQVTLTVANTTSYDLGVMTVSMVAGGSTAVSFSWNTTSARPGLYGLSARVNRVPGESDLSNNSLVKNRGVRLLPFGDINQDGAVSLVDVSIILYDYGSILGDPRWNPYADINGNGIIDILDMGVALLNYGLVT